MKRTINPDNLVWKSEYDIHKYRIDSEHKSLFSLARKALMIRTMDHDEIEIKELKSILQSLSTYVKIHFKNEEQYMQSINYPEIIKHKNLHSVLLKILDNLIRSFNDLSLEEIEKRLYLFFWNNFLTHIINEDTIIGIWSQPLSGIRHNGKWTEKYRTGIDFIDKGHKEIFKILDDSFAEVTEKERDQKIKNVLTHLYNFLKEHFKKEEQFMQEINYSKIKEHKQIHQNIIQSCNLLLQEINQTNSELLEKKLAQLIDEHIINHLVEEDKKITFVQ